MTSSKTFFLLVIIMFALANASSVIYVDHNANATGANGSQESPYLDISSFSDLQQNSDLLFILAVNDIPYSFPDFFQGGWMIKIEPKE